MNIKIFNNIMSDEKSLKKNQLFRKTPPPSIVDRIARLYSINNYDDNIKLTLNKLIQLNTIEKLKDIIPELKQYYVKCKGDYYLENLTPKKTITLLRQLIKTRGYTLSSREKYANGSKYLEYKIVPLKEVKKPTKIIIKFD